MATTIYACIAPEITRLSGSFFDNCARADDSLSEDVSACICIGQSSYTLTWYCIGVGTRPYWIAAGMALERNETSNYEGNSKDSNG